MPYRPLDSTRNEVRVITLLTEKDDPKLGQPVKGLNKIWSLDPFQEAGNCDIDRLWSQPKGRRGHKIQQRLKQTCQTEKSPSSQDLNEDVLPWRYTWGDFVALSYSWGNPKIKKEIIVNDKPLMVTENLDAALRQLRKHRRIQQGFKLWIDAICIQQDANAERKEQVQKMKIIYEGAWQVVVWLGAESNDSDLAMIAIKYLSQLDPKILPNGFYTNTGAWQLEFLPFFRIGKAAGWYSPFHSAVYRALFHLLSRSYWHRCWILQEISCGTPLTPILCGDRVLLWKDFHHACLFMKADEARSGWRMLRFQQRSHWHDARVLSFDLTANRLPPRTSTSYSSEKLWDLIINMMRMQDVQNQATHHTQSPEDAMATFSVLRAAEVTYDRDKVYGSLALAGISKPAVVIPDYQKSTAEVYIEFSKAMYLSGNLDGLRLVVSEIGQVDLPSQHFHAMTEELKRMLAFLPTRPMPGKQTCSQKLPSWVMCWTCCQPLTTPLIGAYNACGMMTAQPSFSVSNGIEFMTTPAVLFDSVNALTAFHRYESNPDYPHPGSHVSSFYATPEERRTAFWRTLVADSTQDGHRAPDTWSTHLLDRRFWRGRMMQALTNHLSLSDFFARNESFPLFGNATLAEFIYEQPATVKRGVQYALSSHVLSFLLRDLTPEQLAAVSRAMNVLAWRRMVNTKMGYIGIVPAATTRGDRIAVVPGCRTPLVLRLEGSVFRVIGECYVHGIMQGEVEEMVERGDCRLEDIRLR
ncbi:HET-domain-containing protein [Aulographum hederae CBS 113979]|uniref:HET-domain-containing protein n=1 Tax=Aulographum hederae CBS 113979 TaxID=1176131 RepID=A0A6G1GMX2_9PEZI|nr:HET-domain-containing protein [Aulographum hederae CBS 113979]